MTDITVNRHKGNPESSAASATIEPAKKLIRVQIETLLYLRGPKGMTSEEVETALGVSHQTASARLSELRARGMVVPGERRLTRAGCWARAMVHVDYEYER